MCYRAPQNHTYVQETCVAHRVQRHGWLCCSATIGWYQMPNRPLAMPFLAGKLAGEPLVSAVWLGCCTCRARISQGSQTCHLPTRLWPGCGGGGACRQLPCRGPARAAVTQTPRLQCPSHLFHAPERPPRHSTRAPRRVCTRRTGVQAEGDERVCWCRRVRENSDRQAAAQASEIWHPAAVLRRRPRRRPADAILLASSRHALFHS